MTMPSRREQVEQKIYHCIESAFRETIGDNTARAIFYRIYGRSKPIDVESYANALEDLFGSEAHIIERHILEKLYSQAGRTFQEKEGHKFIDYINEARTFMLRDKNQKEG